MKKYKNILYALCCLSFCAIVGGALYEHLVVVPQWVKAVPASLAMFQGEYAVNLAAFWTNIHPIALLLFVMTLIIFWKSPRRINILVSFGTYFLVLVITSLYFVPELMEILETPYATNINESLTARAQLWEKLSHIRLVVIALVSIYLLLGMAKPESRVEN